MEKDPNEPKAAVTVEIRALMVDPVSKMPVVVLRESEAGSLLPIWIGLSEANSIAMELEGVKTPRPMTHDLTLSIIESTGHIIDHILIHGLSDNVFLASIILRGEGRSHLVVDARPSDAIALAIRAGCTILVSREVLQKAGCTDVSEEEAMRQILERLKVEDTGQYEM
jgi:bifunctional DNase/RNase